MIEIYITENIGDQPVKIDEIRKRCWINLISPTEDELRYVQEKLDIISSFLRDPLDEEEQPRIDNEDNQALVIVDVPYVFKERGELRFATIPVGILVLEEHILTICLKENHVINCFRNGKVKDFHTFMKTRFTLQLLYLTAKEFLKYLKYIDKKTVDGEKALHHKSTRNKELYKLFEIEKSLIIFTTSLKSNELVMEKLLRGKHIRMYDEDQELLEDVIVENRQAIEMANVYSTILKGMMDAFSSVISNNLNIAMKFLTSVTIVMAIPNLVSGFFGMNVRLPWETDRFAFEYVLIFSLVISVSTCYILYKKGLF